MAKTDSVLKKLNSMKRNELAAITVLFDPPVVIKKSWNGGQIASAIRRRQLEDSNSAPTPKGSETQSAPGSAALPSNDDFEAATKPEPEPPKDNRGGARPGAGRPKGLTDEKARVKNLPEYPSNPIKQGVQSLFELWATATKIKEVVLDEDEADLLALSITQLHEYYFPGIIPEIAGSWVMLIFAVTTISKSRIELIKTIHAKRKTDAKTSPHINRGKDGIGKDKQGIVPDKIDKADTNL